MPDLVGRARPPPGPGSSSRSPARSGWCRPPGRASSSASESPRRSSPKTTATSPAAVRRATSAASCRGVSCGRPASAREVVPQAQVAGPGRRRRSAWNSAPSSRSAAWRASRARPGQHVVRGPARPPPRGGPAQDGGATTASRARPKFFMARAAAPRFSALDGRWSTRIAHFFPRCTSPLRRRPYNIPAMISDAQLRAQLPHTLRQLDLPALGSSTAARSATTTRAATGS